MAPTVPLPPTAYAPPPSPADRSTDAVPCALLRRPSPPRPPRVRAVVADQSQATAGAVAFLLTSPPPRPTFSSPLQTATNHRPLLPIKGRRASSCARRSDLLSHSLVRPVPSLGAAHPGTLPAAGVSVFQPPKSRRPSSPSSVFNRRREGRDGKKVYYILDGNLAYFEDRIIRLPISGLFALEQGNGSIFKSSRRRQTYAEQGNCDIYRGIVLSKNPRNARTPLAAERYVQSAWGLKFMEQVPLLLVT
uniref:Uncharacterized protein n=1 Tax=Oryza glumipatula TaxID=40148 RepID=A0A0E0B012_9ORYZ